MQVESYTEKSIAVFGDTKPWKDQLKALGGRFNLRLKGGEDVNGTRQGWIFSRSKEADVVEFVTIANNQSDYATEVVAQPDFSLKLNKKPDPIVKLNEEPEPVVKLNKKPVPVVKLNKKPDPFVKLNEEPEPVVKLNKKPVPVVKLNKKPEPMVKLNEEPEPVVAELLPSNPTTVNYPNLFKAADGLTYQIIMYTVPVPHEGQDVILVTGEKRENYKVKRVDSVLGPIKVSSVENLLVEEEAVIINGEWNLRMMQQKHKLNFL